MSEASACILRIIRRHWWQLFWGFVVTVVLMLACFLLPFDAVYTSVARAVGYCLLVAACFMLYTLYRERDPKRDAFYQLVYEQSDQVCWVYHMVLMSMPFGVKTIDRVQVHLRLLNGRTEMLSLQAAELDELMLHLEVLLPHATFGHSPEKEQLYTVSPELLLK